MQFRDVCIESNLAWESNLGKVYHYTDEDGSVKTVFRYQIPFSPDTEAAFLRHYNIPASARMQFYQNLVRCIQRQVNVSTRLASLSVPSILTYSRVEQERGENDAVIIYLETEQVWPITDRLLGSDCSYLTLLDITSRLALILRDIYRSNAAVIHRGLDLREVYINSSNRILLGGFFYAHCNGLGSFPDYLPCNPPHVPYSLLHGDPGSHKTDIQTLSLSVWNLFSGIPYNAEWATKRMPVPEYAQSNLVDALILGIAGEDDVCNLYRRKLSEHRKQIARETTEPVLVPIRKPLQKKIEITWISAVPSGTEENNITEKEEHK